MKDKQTFFAVLMVALLAPAAALADPVTAWVATTLAVSTATAAFIVRMGISLLLSSLSSALRRKPGQPRQPGIKTESTTSGGSNPQSFILGTYATAGNMVAPPYSHPNDGDIPNKWLTYVVDISDMPGVQFSRIMVAGEYVTDLEPAEGLTHDLRGMLQDDGGYYLRMTWHDGTQTVADAYMLENYADHPDRPWGEDMVGTGVAYAVLTFHYNRKLFNQLPGVRFEVQGIPLYDPRKDGTVGGTGAHRWDDPATWEFTDNPVVMVYNILRGIALPDGQRWGGHAAASALPLDNWFAGMNECDSAVSLADGGSEPQYRAGFEVLVDDEPAEVIQELLKACSAEITELGGTYKVRVGPPSLPVYFFTDEDVIADRPQSLAPYPGLDGVHNAIHATHPEPESLWESRDAPPRFNSEWEAEDGGRQLVAEVDLPAVASGTQVQRLMKAWIEDERRFRRHSLTLPPDAAMLEPLDTAAWTSTREGYSAKLFEVGELTDDLSSCLQTLALRERDAGDFTWTPGTDEVPVDHPSTTVTEPGPRTLPGFDLLAHSLADGAGAPRRPALRMVWTAAELLGDDVMEWEVQLADETPVAEGRAASALSGAHVVAAGILPDTDYRARGRIRGRNDGVWTGWKIVRTSDVRLSYGDLADQIEQEVDAAQAAADAAGADALQALADAAAVQGQFDGLVAGYTGSTLEQSLTDLLNDANAYTDVSETALSARIGQNAKDVFTFEAGGGNWTRGDTNIANPARVSDADIASTDKGFAVQSTGFRFVNPVAVLPLTDGHTYEFEALVRCTRDSTITGGSRETILLYVTRLNADGSVAGYSALSAVGSFTPTRNPLRVADGWVTLKGRYTPSNGVAGDYIRGRLYACYDGSGTYGDMDWEVAMFRFQDITNARTIEADLENNYYTAVNTDNAIAARELFLQGQIDGTNSNLSTNYYTSAETDDAVALSEQTLQVSIDTARAMDLPSGFGEGDKYWTSTSQGSPAPAGEPGAAGALDSRWAQATSGNGYPVMQLTATEINGNTIWLMQRGVFTPQPGRRYRVRIYCNLWGTVTSGTPQISLFFRSQDKDYNYVAAPGFGTRNLTVGGWHMYETEVLCDDANAEAFWRAGMYVRGTDFTMDTANGGFNIQSVEVDDITEAVELSGEITDIKAVDVNALSGTAIGTLLTQLAVDAGGTSATLTNQGAAIADLEGNASAGYLIKAQAGSEVSLLQLVAADGSAGSVSVAKLSATDILLDGTVYARSLFLGDWANLMPDVDFNDESIWSGVTSFHNAVNPDTWGGAKYAKIVGTAGSYAFTYGPAFHIDPAGETLKIRWRGKIHVGTSGDPGVTLNVQYGNQPDLSDAANIWPPNIAHNTTNITDITSTVTIPAGYRYARLRVYKQNSNVTEVRFGGIEVRRMNAADLLVDGGVSADHMAANSITAENAAIKDLAVGRLKLSVGSVTELVRLSKTDTTSVAYNTGSRSSSQSDLNTYYAASGTSNMHHVTSAKLSYTVPANDPPEKLLIMPSARMGMTFWDYNTGQNRAYNLTAATRVRVAGADVLGYLMPGSNYSFYRSAQMSVPLVFEYPDVLLELGSDYSAGDTIDFDVFVYRGDNGANFLFGFNMREHTVDILEFYK